MFTLSVIPSERANETLGKHRSTKELWVTPKILALCDRRREKRRKMREQINVPAIQRKQPNDQKRKKRKKNTEALKRTQRRTIARKHSHW